MWDLKSHPPTPQSQDEPPHVTGPASAVEQFHSSRKVHCASGQRTLEDERARLVPGPQLKGEALPVGRHLIQGTLDARLPAQGSGLEQAVVNRAFVHL
jgi:hypothetical protein